MASGLASGVIAGLIAALAGAAVVLGLVLTGGPGHARKQARDVAREQDLMQIAHWVTCLANETGQLPQALAASPACNWRLGARDPQGGTAYRYEVIGPNTFRLCAAFELPPVRPDDRWGRDADGCIRRDWWPEKDRR